MRAEQSRAEQSRAEQSRAEQSRAEQIYAIDVVKFFMAFCVIAIHTLPLKNVHNEVLIKLFNTGVSIAVPFFFLSSGYLVARRFSMDKKRNLLLIDKQIKKLLQYYIIWTVIYLPLTIYGFIQSGSGFKRACALFLRNIIFQGENYYSWPLWFLLSSIYGFIIFRCLVEKTCNFEKFGFMFVCFFATLQFAVDYIIAMNTANSALRIISVLLEKTIGKGRIFSGIYYILLGALVARKNISLNRNQLIVCFAILYVAGAFTALNFICIIMCVIFFMFVLTMYATGSNGNRFRRTSTVMYYTHMIFLFLLNRICRHDMYGVSGFVFCCIMTNILAYVLNASPYKNSKVIKLLFGKL